MHHHTVFRPGPARRSRTPFLGQQLPFPASHDSYTGDDFRAPVLSLADSLQIVQWRAHEVVSSVLSLTSVHHKLSNVQSRMMHLMGIRRSVDEATDTSLDSQSPQCAFFIASRFWASRPLSSDAVRLNLPIRPPPSRIPELERLEALCAASIDRGKHPITSWDIQMPTLGSSRSQLCRCLCGENTRVGFLESSSSNNYILCHDDEGSEAELETVS